MITYNWQLDNLDRKASNGLVTTAHWRCTATDGDYSASVYGTVGLPLKDPTDPTFVAYDEITKVQAIEWTKAALGEEAVTAFEKSIDDQILAQKEPKTASGTPWSTA